MIWTPRERPSFGASSIVKIVVALVLSGILFAGLLASPAYAKTFTVNSTGDAGDEFPPDKTCDSDPSAAVRCTLREAIDSANANNNNRTIDIIKFNIPTTELNCSPTSKVCTIFAASGMPQIEEPLTIDGYTQGKGTTNTTEDDARPNTLVVGNNAVLKIELKSVTGVGAGLWISTKKSTVKGLIINRWEEGVRIDGPGSRANKVEGNFIGTDFSGTVTDPDGTPNSGDELGNTFGVTISEVPNNMVGGTTPAARNVISGSDQSGVSIGFAGATGNKVMGNYIGTEKNGTADLGNVNKGVFVHNGAANNIIGGTKATMRNVISGNDQSGVEITTAATGNRVMGNFIGTDASGTQDLGNLFFGVLIDDAPRNTIGGPVTSKSNPRNIISGNDSSGVAIDRAEGNNVLGNFIGTDASGTQDLGNTFGVIIDDAPDNTVGGTTAGARNVISGNDDNGVNISGGAARVNKVMGNYIGTRANGTEPLGNSDHGVIIATSDNTVGGTTAGARNIISGNEGAGVFISGTATGNSILSNSIFSNDDPASPGPELGIDLGPTAGVTANDTGDSDTGPNNRQNFPVLSSATRSGKKTVIQGTLDSTVVETFTIQFFSSPAADPSGQGEGKTLLGQKSVTTDAGGDADFSFAASSNKIPPGGVVTATATNQSTDDTSEFSIAIPVSS